MNNSIFKDNKVTEVNIEKLEVHDIANLNRDLNNDEFQELKDDIELNGQLVPIYIWRNKIIDGRHRVKALKELGLDTVKALEIKHKTSLAQLRDFVIGLEKRRHDNQLQKTIKALEDYENNNITIREIAKKYNISSTTLDKIKKIKELLLQRANGDRIWKNMYINGGITLNNNYLTQVASILRALENSREIKDSDTLSPEAKKANREIIEKHYNNGDIAALSDLRTLTSKYIKKILKENK